MSSKKNNKQKKSKNDKSAQVNAEQKVKNKKTSTPTNSTENENDRRVEADQQRESLIKKFEQLKEELSTAQEKERRALADYQNLLRRTEQERSRVAQFANKYLLQGLLPVVENLDKAAKQLNDSGLNIVVNQLWDVLKEVGLEKIEAEGKEFDVETMEAVGRKGEGDQVIDVIQAGYKLKGEVIQHAKVVLGESE